MSLDIFFFYDVERKDKNTIGERRDNADSIHEYKLLVNKDKFDDMDMEKRTERQ